MIVVIFHKWQLLSLKKWQLLSVNKWQRSSVWNKFKYGESLLVLLIITPTTLFSSWVRKSTKEKFTDCMKNGFWKCKEIVYIFILQVKNLSSLLFYELCFCNILHFFRNICLSVFGCRKSQFCVGRRQHNL